MPRLAMTYTRLRAEERLLVEAASAQGLTLEPVSDEETVFDIHAPTLQADAVLCRTLGANRALNLLAVLERHGVPTVNTHQTSANCADKALTSLLLAGANVPTPRTRVAFTPKAALQALEGIGYPAVLKPTTGSWARLISRVDNPEQARAILEHKASLPNPQHHVYYLQEYIDKDGGGEHGDIRAFVVGDQTIAAIWRRGPHWITNTARGARAENCPVSEELNDLCLRAAEAVGGGVLAVDVMQRGDEQLVHEVNHTMEFRNSIAPTGVDIPARIIEHLVEAARQ